MLISFITFFKILTTNTFEFAMTSLTLALNYTQIHNAVDTYWEWNDLQNPRFGSYRGLGVTVFGSVYVVVVFLYFFTTPEIS